MEGSLGLGFTPIRHRLDWVAPTLGRTAYCHYRIGSTPDCRCAEYKKSWGCPYRCSAAALLRSRPHAGGWSIARSTASAIRNQTWGGTSARGTRQRLPQAKLFRHFVAEGCGKLATHCSPGACGLMLVPPRSATRGEFVGWVIPSAVATRAPRGNALADGFTHRSGQPRKMGEPAV